MKSAIANRQSQILRRCSGQVGFTLIELLVVVTIIVVLLALLAPALDKAIEQTQRAVCATQLHGYTSIVVTYAMDHKRYTAQIPGESTVPAHWLWDSQYGYVEALFEYGLGSRDNGDLMYCPSNPTVKPENFWYGSEFENNGDGFLMTSYQMYHWRPVTPDPYPRKNWMKQYTPNGPRPIVKITDESVGVLPIASDSVIDFGGTGNWSNYGWNNLGNNNHMTDELPAGGNIAMIGGSVTWRPFDEMSPKYPQWFYW